MRGNRWVLAAALALVVVGVVGVLAQSDDDSPALDRETLAATTSTTGRTEVLGVVVDNTTTTAPVAVASTVTTGAPTTTTAVRATAGRVWGYSYPSSGSDQTTVTLAQNGTTVATAKTDDNGLFEFTKVAPGDYKLSRTSTSSQCTTTTTSGQQPTCTMASSTSMGPEFTLSPGGEVRADVF
jgi:hypothetical protein